MAKLRLDLRKVLRAIANAVQLENADRLLAGTSVRGDALAPKVTPAPTKKGPRKRIRVFGVRIALRDLAGRLGVKSGDMLKDAQRAGNAKIGRTSFKIIPGAGVILRWRVFNRGSKHQERRPFSGISGARLEEARARILTEARNQLVLAMRDREKPHA